MKRFIILFILISTAIQAQLPIETLEELFAMAEVGDIIVYVDPRIPVYRFSENVHSMLSTEKSSVVEVLPHYGVQEKSHTYVIQRISFESVSTVTLLRVNVDKIAHRSNAVSWARGEKGKPFSLYVPKNVYWAHYCSHLVYQAYLWGTVGREYNLDPNGGFYVTPDDLRNDDDISVIASWTNPEENLIANGNFEFGNRGFSTDYLFNGEGEGAYYIDSDAGKHNYWWFGGDHTTGRGLFMIVNGAYDEHRIVWSQTIHVPSQSHFVFSFYYRKVDRPHNDYAKLKVTFNGEQVGSVTTVSNDSWLRFWVSWSSGNSTEAHIEILDILTQSGGNGGDDFGLDDITLIQHE